MTMTDSDSDNVNFIFRDLVHRQTACAAVKHMALGVFGFGCEDALTHLMNYVWPNVFETSPHLVQVIVLVQLNNIKNITLLLY